MKLRQFFRWIRAFMIVSLVAAAVSSAHSRFSQANEKSGKDQSGEKWYGGKPRPPVQIRFSSVTPLPPNTPTTVSLQVLPQAACARLHVMVRGIHGVEILNGANQVASCQAGVAVPFTITLLVPSSVSGKIVADVSFETGGRSYSASGGTVISAIDAVGNQKAELGKLKVDPNGNAFVALKAEETVQ